jgi:WD40 repeat protein
VHLYDVRFGRGAEVSASTARLFPLPFDRRGVFVSQCSVLATYSGHTNAVMSVQWSPHQAGYFTSSSSDGSVVLWQIGGLQPKPFNAPGSDDAAHTGDGETTLQPTLAQVDAACDIITSEGAVPDLPVAPLVHASPTKPAKRSRRNTETELPVVDTEPPEIVFRHAGHRAEVVDMQWCTDPYDPWLFASVSDDSTNPRLGGGSLQIWRILDLVFGLSPADRAKVMHHAASVHHKTAVHGSTAPPME